MSGNGYPVRWHGRRAVVTLPEQIDVSSSGLIREQLLAIINRGATALIADMTATISCDHSGADAVVRACRRAAASGTKVRLVVTAQIVRRVLAISGLDRLVSIYPSLEAAMAAKVPAARTPPAPDGAPPGPGPAITPAVVWEMVESFGEGVALAGGDGVIALASRRLEDMFGYERAGLAGHAIGRLVPPGLQAACREHQAGHAGARLTGRRKDGTTFPVEVSLSPLVTRTGQFTVAVIRDITPARRPGEPAGPAPAPAAAEQAGRDGALLDAIVTRLFRAGLSLQAAAGQPDGLARHAIGDALRELDETIREIRDTVFAAGTADPGA